MDKLVPTTPAGYDGLTFASPALESREVCVKYMDDSFTHEHMELSNVDFTESLELGVLADNIGTEDVE